MATVIIQQQKGVDITIEKVPTDILATIISLCQTEGDKNPTKNNTNIN